MKTTHRAELSGSGPLTVEGLADITDALTNAVPFDAQVVIRADQDPRDHDWSWHAIATWETGE